MAKTYNDIYIQARRRLKDAGIEAYGLEARLIVSQAAGKTMEKLMRDLNLYASDEFAGTVAQMVERRVAGEPVAYITGQWEFYGVPLYRGSRSQTLFGGKKVSVSLFQISAQSLTSMESLC